MGLYTSSGVRFLFYYFHLDIPVEVSVGAFCSSYDGNVREISRTRGSCNAISVLLLFMGVTTHLISFLFVIIRFLRRRNTQATFPC